MGFGQQYQQHGVKEFYLNMKESYVNPHAKDIQTLVKRYADPSKSYLDLAAGDGLVTKALIEAGCHHVEGLEPFIPDQYVLNTSKPCSLLSFQDIAQGSLRGSYGTIVCSYALHLLEKSFLPQFLYHLTNHASELIILTPHKRPVIDDFWYLEKEDKLNKTKLKLYRKNI